MKTKFLIFFSLVFLSGTSRLEKIDVEKEAIKTILNQERDAFMAKDMDKVASFYVQDELNTRLQQMCSKEFPVYSGWNEVKTFLETIMNEPGDVNITYKNSKEDFIIKIKGDCAWVVNKDVWTWEVNGKTKAQHGIQTTFMEKIKGSWKISLMSCFYPPVME